MVDYGNYRIELSEEWSLEDLYFFPRAYEQVYFFYTSFHETSVNIDRERIEQAYNSFPWQGGYSSVNFFNKLKYAAPKRFRPKIVSIQKSSPGHFDLSLFILTAVSLSYVVKKIAGAIDSANDTYRKIQKGMQDRELLRLKIARERLRFDNEEIRFIETSSKSMAKLLGFSSPRVIDKLTGHPYLTLKILLTVFRRIRTLCEYERQGKAHLTDEELSLLNRPKLKRLKTRTRLSRDNEET